MYVRNCLGIILFVSCWTWSQVKATCQYESTRYSEGSAVPTAEPCLRCACARGVLLCYLRVCPQLPDPPPLGCLILHKHRTCCPELICSDLPTGGNRIEARLEPDIPEIPYNHSMIGNGCVHNGTLYGSGSAMTTSSLCEYCYCISGKEHCVKPKCLLPTAGCTPTYAPHSCCPTHYKCTNGRRRIPSTSTTTAASPLLTADSEGGCLVSGARYREGGKILGVGHSPCDNCYCMRGVVRCVPLSCAPPLLGCTPVVPTGECCAASYNCSGTIEVQPNLNYGPYPDVSKDYAKLRKEVQQKYHFKPRPSPDTLSSSETKNPHYIVAQSQLSQTSTSQNFSSKTSTPYYFTSTTQPVISTAILPTSRQYMATTRHLPFEPDVNNYSRISLTTTRVKQNENANAMRPIFLPLKLETTTLNSPSPIYKPSGFFLEQDLTSRRNFESNSSPKYLNYIDTEYSEDMFVDGRNNRRIDDQMRAESNIQVTVNVTSKPTESSTQEESTESTVPTETTVYTSTDSTTDYSTTEYSATTNIETTTDFSTTWTKAVSTSLPEVTLISTLSTNSTRTILNITGELIGNNTNCIDGPLESADNRPEHRLELSDLDVQESTTEEPTTLEPDYTSTVSPTTEEVSNTVATNTSTLSPFKKLPPGLESILNITKNINKKDEDYDYDYSEPNLPPSLPNLKIIPFVAADAVLEEKETGTASYPTDYSARSPDSLHGTSDDPLYGYTLNLFSPPIETEGGFVPRDPPLQSNNFYENGYHTTGIVDISGTVPAITNPPKTNEDNCITEGREVRHGELSSEIGACAVCICLFGDIVCQPPKCPQLPVGCRRQQPAPGSTLCCGNVVCNGDADSPTVVLDRIDVTSNPQDNPAQDQTPDPFRDVIHTEPAPNLQSLIGDIMPYLVRKSSTLKPTTHMTTLQPPPLPSSTTKNQYSTTELSPETKHEDINEFSFDSVLKLLFSDEKPVETPTSTTVKATEQLVSSTNTPTTQSKYRTPPTTNSWFMSAKTQTDVPNRNSIEVPSSVGLLKLAGCNIYGRMYRVGRIISELSGPCLECMCTEIGVQCRPLNC